MDLIEFLQENDIEYYTEGKNISPGWTGLQCPYCDDQSNHCGISPDAKRFSCWKCGETGKLYRLITQLIDVSFEQAHKFAYSIGQDTLGGTEERSSVTADSTLDRPVQGILPKSCSSKFPGVHKKYLRSRGFAVPYLKKEYKIKAVHTVGRYRFRVIIPYYLNGEVVNFVARDVTDKSRKKYLACNNNRATIPIKSTFYNIDRIGKQAIIVEGVTDVWRIGKGAIASSGTIITNEQLLMLTEKEVEKAYIVFDEDAVSKADRYANKLSAVMKVEVIELENGDPAEQDAQTISEIRGLLL